MINAITTKLELDIMQASEIVPAIQFATAHCLPAVVIHPQLTAQAQAMRAKCQRRLKLITTLDWPKGDSYGMLKLRGMTTGMMAMDGYEIMLTGGVSEIDTCKEAMEITTFLRNAITPLLEVRFVLGVFSRPEAEVMRICRALSTVPLPTMLRTDHHLRMQVTKANPKASAVLVAKIKACVAAPIKLSGNVDTLRALAGSIHAGGERFAVSLQQAQAIVTDLKNQPDGLQQLLAGDGDQAAAQ